MFKEIIKTKKTGFITYGITPPKQRNAPEKLTEISQNQIRRIKELDIDALVIYDIQDESDRTSEERPFPFLPSLDSMEYSDSYLDELDVPKIVYRCVGKYSQEELANELSNKDSNSCMVFVGAASSKQQVMMTLGDAYSLYQNTPNNTKLGGVCIPERHQTKKDEHLRMIEKAKKGCSFFITQTVYDVSAAKDFLSDYYYHCQKENIEMQPIIFTLAPCGSLKTMEFMKWLGVSFPTWIENELANSVDILHHSVDYCVDIFKDLYSYAHLKHIPVGFNIESVSIRKKEIDASVELLKRIREEL
ncbi:methylenetetrahydrofolate reductase [Sediminitomix flava]|uniref:Methylenetetrahydrofolate reductase n=1 Tax=Sediminitomix flava TaxID=379075 RepID=A0A315Z7E3_SEDFL|nr:methylenetetrahydrofolate reductase [Sediminitomix flava]PWJ39335.1 methylene-tetrahydrofolate reductase-like protein [Sediminitomix flava]